MSAKILQFFLGEVLKVHGSVIEKTSHDRMVEEAVWWPSMISDRQGDEFCWAGRRRWGGRAGQQQGRGAVVEVVDGISVSPDEGVLMFGCPVRRFCRCEGSLIDEHADCVHKIRPFPEPSCVESGEFRVGDGKSRDFVNEFTDYRLPSAVLEDRQEKAVERALPCSG